MINYVNGDATYPLGQGPKLIVHCCNDVGKWGAGFVLAISKRWKTPEAAYRLWKETDSHPDNPFRLGSIQVVPVDPKEEIAVINLIGQHGCGSRRGRGYPYIRYEALREGLQRVSRLALQWNASIHMPRIGCGLAGGSWNCVSHIIEEALVDLDVTVYDFE